MLKMQPNCGRSFVMDKFNFDRIGMHFSWYPKKRLQIQSANQFTTTSIYLCIAAAPTARGNSHTLHVYIYIVFWINDISNICSVWLCYSSFVWAFSHCLARSIGPFKRINFCKDLPYRGTIANRLVLLQRHAVQYWICRTRAHFIWKFAGRKKCTKHCAHTKTLWIRFKLSYF